MPWRVGHRALATEGSQTNGVSVVSMSMRTRFSVAAPAAVGTIRGSKRSRLVIIALLILPLAACAVGPDFVSPAAPISDNFVGANSRSIKTNRRGLSRLVAHVSRSDAQSAD